MVSYTYDAWGNLLSCTGDLATTIGVLNPLRYRGYVYDTETGFYYLQSRYYDPTICRFLNADAYASTGQGFVGNNMFAYCNNNPVCFVDATGTIPYMLWFLAIIHKCVLVDIAMKYNYAIEVYVRGIDESTKKGYIKGYLDVYDPQTNTYYEVKHRSNACKMLAVKQMHNYALYKIHDSRFSEMTLYDNAIAIPGKININGSFAYGDWYVEYSLESPGLITYTYERMKEQENYNYAYNYYHVGVWDKMENKLPIAFSMFAVISIVYSVCSYGERPILFTKD